MRVGSVQQRRLRRAATTLVGLCAAGLLVAGCDGSIELPDSSGTRSGLSLPTLSGLRPSRTGAAESTTVLETTETETTETETTEAETTEPETTEAETTEAETTEAETTEPTTTEPTTTEPTTTEPTAVAAGEDDEVDADEADDASPWLWWILGALVLVAAAAIPIGIVSRRRRAWREDLETARLETEWFAHSLIPALASAVSSDGVRGGWTVAAPRVQALEDSLTTLAVSAPDETRGLQVTQLRDVVRLAGQRIATLAGAGLPDVTGQLGEIATDLEAALSVRTWNDR